MLVFLIIFFNILGHVEKNYFKRKPFLKGSFFDTFTLRHAIISSLILSRVGPALVKAAYDIACPQLNGNTLITLYAVLLMLERVWTRLPGF